MHIKCAHYFCVLYKNKQSIMYILTLFLNFFFEMYCRILFSLDSPSTPLPSFLLQGQNELLGMVRCQPVVRLNADMPGSALEWYEISRYGQYAGDLLAAFELLLVHSLSAFYQCIIINWSFFLSCHNPCL